MIREKGIFISFSTAAQNAPYLGRENWNCLGVEGMWNVELLWCQRRFPLLCSSEIHSYTWSNPGE